MFTNVIERLNDRRDAAGDAGDDAGFTLIELMVVLLILAILLAIAIPTFLGLTGGANDRAAQANLNTAITNAKSAASLNNQTYGGLTVGQLQTNEPAITWIGGAVGKAGPVSVYLDPGGSGVVLASWSPNFKGTCWFAVDNISAVSDPAGPYGATASGVGTATQAPSNAGTFYTFDHGGANGVTAANCDATKAPGAAYLNAAKWPTNWPQNQ
jgi:type IV pilus assembly protein PilA